MEVSEKTIINNPVKKVTKRIFEKFKFSLEEIKRSSGKTIKRGI